MQNGRKGLENGITLIFSNIENIEGLQCMFKFLGVIDDTINSEASTLVQEEVILRLGQVKLF